MRTRSQGPKWIALGTGLGAGILALAGCASQVEYPLQKRSIFTAERAHPMKVAVATFSDERPPEERDLKIRIARKDVHADAYTSDEDFSGHNLAPPLTRMTAKHLAFSNLFERVDAVEVTSEQVRGKKENLKELGVQYDAVMVGRIKHFVGYFHRDAARDWLFLPLGGTGFAINSLIPSDVKADAQLDDVKLVSLKTGRELWKGAAACKWDKERSLPGGRRDNALIAWRNAVNDLAKQLVDAKFDGVN
ncbi:MAG: hypothetical protein HYZ53_23980 [Planctomycetes bacterium]|nr:hypothetical protein [Planctomycetota bacterium]